MSLKSAMTKASKQTTIYEDAFMDGWKTIWGKKMAYQKKSLDDCQKQKKYFSSNCCSKQYSTVPIKLRKQSKTGLYLFIK